jgi:selenophosphate synthetase-related protein
LPTGNVGIDVDVPSAAHAETEADQQFAALFAEELGLVLEVSSQNVESVVAAFEREKVPVTRLGSVTAEKKVTVKVGGSVKIEVRNPAFLRFTGCQA